MADNDRMKSNALADEHVKGAIVTGASGGIGRVVAKRLARDGFAIIVNCAGNPARADEVAAEVKATGAQLTEPHRRELLVHC